MTEQRKPTGTAEIAGVSGDHDAPVTREADEVASSVPPEMRQEPLFAEADSERFRSRWKDIQTGFVDEPRKMVKEADALVAELMQQLAKQFSDARSELEAQWDRTDDVSTEDLRVALTRYRSFFERLLAA